MNNFKTLLFSALIVLPLHAEDAAEWETLFNGKDLEGWTPKIRGHEAGVNDRNTFRVVDGVIRVDYSDYEEWKDDYGHLFYKTPYSNYRLKLEYRFLDGQLKGGPGWANRNSGVMIHSESPETMTLEQDFPTSIEVQLLGGTGEGDRHTGNLCTPGTNIVLDGKLETRHCTDSNSETFHGEQWVTIEIEVRGSEQVRHLINGVEVMKYEQPQYDTTDPHAKQLAEASGGTLLEKGYFCLQSESHPCEFRNIRIQKIEK